MARTKKQLPSSPARKILNRKAKQSIEIPILANKINSQKSDVKKRTRNIKSKNQKLLNRLTKKRITNDKEAIEEQVETSNIAQTTINDDEHFDRCKEWLVKQKREIKTFDKIDNDIPDDKSTDSDDVEMNFQAESHRHQQPTKQNLPTTSKSKTDQTKCQVLLLCEWKRCSHESNNFDAFKDHVCNAHLHEIEGNTPATTITTTATSKIKIGGEHFDGGDNEIVCCWDLCTFKSIDPIVIRMHLFYHIYHTNLKSIGESLLMRKTLPVCCVDSRRRNNILPNGSKGDKYLCQWNDCNEKFEKIYELFEHVREHCQFEASLRRKHEKDGRFMKCGWPMCEKKFDILHPFINHVRTHTMEKTMACPNCGSTFNSYNKFYCHFTRQAVNKPYECPHCPKTFYTEDLLNTHAYFHVNRFKCTMCDMTCPSPSALTQHVRYRHIKERPFKCPQCTYKAVIKTDLDRHILLIHETNIYQCSEFGCIFSTKSLWAIKKHYKKVHYNENRVYSCHCCQKRFKFGGHLSQHLIKQHKFQLPSGHTRFNYRQDIDGFYRLQTMRMESLEVTEQIMSPVHLEHSAASIIPDGNVIFTITELDATQNGKVNIEIFASSVGAADDKQIDNAANKEIGCYAGEEDVLSMPNILFSDTDNYSDDDDESMSQFCNTYTVVPSCKTEISVVGGVDDDDDEDNNVETNTKQYKKNIQDFSVMKRYLRHTDNDSNNDDKKCNSPSPKLQNQILIELNEVDKDGNLVTREIIRTEELSIRKM